MSFDYKKSLGQNFLKDKNIIDKISNSINTKKDDLIIEIGPGAGALTSKLINKGCDVICFEIDERLEELLNKIKKDNLKIVFDDFLKVDKKVSRYKSNTKANKWTTLPSTCSNFTEHPSSRRSFWCH